MSLGFCHLQIKTNFHSSSKKNKRFNEESVGWSGTETLIILIHQYQLFSLTLSKSHSSFFARFCVFSVLANPDRHCHYLLARNQLYSSASNYIQRIMFKREERTMQYHDILYMIFFPILQRFILNNSSF